MKRQILIILSLALIASYQAVFAASTAPAEHHVYIKKEGDVTVYSDQPFVGAQRDDSLTTTTSSVDNAAPSPSTPSQPSAKPGDKPAAAPAGAKAVKSETSKADQSAAAPTNYTKLGITQPQEDNKTNIYNSQASVIVKAHAVPALQKGDKVKLSMRSGSTTLFTALGNADGSSVDMSGVKSNESTKNAPQITANISANEEGTIDITLASLTRQNFWPGNKNTWNLSIVRNGNSVIEAKPVAFTVMYERKRPVLLQVSHAHVIFKAIVDTAKNVLSPI